MRTKSARNPCYGTPIRPFSGHSHGIGGWWPSGSLRDPEVEVGGTFDFRAGHVVRHVIDDSRGSNDNISQPESARRQAGILWLGSPAHRRSWREWMCRSTQHISDWLLDAMDGNRSHNASDNKGWPSFGCILEMLEPSLWPGRHIAANAACLKGATVLRAEATIPPRFQAFLHAIIPKMQRP